VLGNRYLSSSIATFRRAALVAQARVDSLNAEIEEQGSAAAAADGAAEPPHMIRRLRTLNDALMLTERAFIVSEGLPGRAWFKHAIFSPGKHNTYAAEKFPGVSDALSEGKLSLAVTQLHVVCRAIVAAADTLDPPALDASRAGRDEL
jgi:N-acetylated-alpha-linked acidic dipeptidase